MGAVRHRHRHRRLRWYGSTITHGRTHPMLLLLAAFTVFSVVVVLLLEAAAAFNLPHHHKCFRTQESSPLSPSSVLTLLHLSSRKDINGNDAEDVVNPPATTTGIRLNKVFRATHSRRQSDALIASGRVSVNGSPVEDMGRRVVPFVDTVELDGKIVRGWEKMNGIVEVDHRGEAAEAGGGGRRRRRNGGTRRRREGSTTEHQDQVDSRAGGVTRESMEHFDYVKYWKPRGVTCTTDRSVRSNIIDDVMRRGGFRPKHRIFPVGRLDRDSTGLILLTSDGRVPNALLRGEAKQPKTYEVVVDRPIGERDVRRLAEGVVITTVAQRDGRRAEPLTARTLPCRVERIVGDGGGRGGRGGGNGLRITLTEGRNRQIRRMCLALGYDVVKLHRVEFAQISLGPALVGPGRWARLDKGEMDGVYRAIVRAEEASSSSAATLS